MKRFECFKAAIPLLTISSFELFVPPDKKSIRKPSF